MKNFSSLCLSCDSSGSIHQHWVNESRLSFIFSNTSLCCFSLYKLCFLVLIHAQKHIQGFNFLPYFYKQSGSILFILVRIRREGRRISFSYWFWSSNRYCQIHKAPPQWELQRLLSFIFLWNSRVISVCSCIIHYKNRTMISLGPWG